MTGELLVFLGAAPLVAVAVVLLPAAAAVLGQPSGNAWWLLPVGVPAALWGSR